MDEYAEEIKLVQRNKKLKNQGSKATNKGQD